MKFWHVSLPFVMVNAVVWGVANISLPILAGTDARAGMVFAMLNLGVALGAPLWGHLSRRIRISALLFSSAILSAAIWVVLSLAGGRALAFLAFSFGISTAAVFTLATVRVTNLYPKEQWDKYIARMQSYMTLGQVIGLLTASIHAGAVMGVPFLIVSVLATLPVRLAGEKAAIRHFIHTRHHIPKARFFDIMAARSHMDFRFRHFVHLKNAPLLVFYVRWILILLAPAPVFAMYPLLMKGSFNVGTSISAIAFSGSTFLAAMLFICAGKLAKSWSPFGVFNVGAVANVVGFSMMYAVSFGVKGWLGVSGFILVVASWAFTSVGMNVGVVELVSPEKEGEALGLANTFMSLDNVVGGLLGGILASVFGYPIVFLIGLGLSLAAFGLEFPHFSLRGESSSR